MVPAVEAGFISESVEPMPRFEPGTFSLSLPKGQRLGLWPTGGSIVRVWPPRSGRHQAELHKQRQLIPSVHHPNYLAGSNLPNADHQD